MEIVEILGKEEMKVWK